MRLRDIKWTASERVLMILALYVSGLAALFIWSAQG